MNVQLSSVRVMLGKKSQQFHTTHRHHLDTSLKSTVIK